MVRDLGLVSWRGSLHDSGACSPVDAGAEYNRFARRWLEGVLSEVFPAQLDGLRTRPATHRVTTANMHLPWGEPGQVRGVLRFPSRDAMYTPAAWQRMLCRLEACSTAWADFAYRQAAGMDAVVGVVSDLGGVQILEETIFPPVAVHPRQWREVLYGYSWITIMPPELVRVSAVRQR
jgi:hypothetical protein